MCRRATSLAGVSDVDNPTVCVGRTWQVSDLLRSRHLESIRRSGFLSPHFLSSTGELSDSPSASRRETVRLAAGQKGYLSQGRQDTLVLVRLRRRQLSGEPQEYAVAPIVVLRQHRAAARDC